MEEAIQPDSTEQKVVERVVIEVTRDAGVPERHDYIVTSENGLFKNGQQYNKGDTIQLDDATASNFIAVGDVALTGEGQ